MEPVACLERLEECLRQEDFLHETDDREDHTFCGIMVDLLCSDKLPCEYVEVQSVWVRGQLGPLTVYTSNRSYKECMSNPSDWEVRHKATYGPSFHNLVELKLDPPLMIQAGARAGLYVHSALENDEAIVYDNIRRGGFSYWQLYADDDEDYDDAPVSPGEVFSISVGQAHLSPIPFKGRAPWGSGPWRRHREFVGRISYGVRWLLWTPKLHHRFPTRFRKAAEVLLMGAKRPESNLSNLRDEVIFYILNRCGWDWFGTDCGVDGAAGGRGVAEHPWLPGQQDTATQEGHGVGGGGGASTVESAGSEESSGLEREVSVEESSRGASACDSA
uniref:Uncharacterized protein n=1 Tax=Tetraselmis sp. GSL018 TaxID=582737 RepID=A0A061R2E7_9CHLO